MLTFFRQVLFGYHLQSNSTQHITNAYMYNTSLLFITTSYARAHFITCGLSISVAYFMFIKT